SCFSRRRRCLSSPKDLGRGAPGGCHAGGGGLAAPTPITSTPTGSPRGRDASRPALSFSRNYVRALWGAHGRFAAFVFTHIGGVRPRPTLTAGARSEPAGCLLGLEVMMAAPRFGLPFAPRALAPDRGV